MWRKLKHAQIKAPVPVMKILNVMFQFYFFFPFGKYYQGRACWVFQGKLVSSAAGPTFLLLKCGFMTKAAIWRRAGKTLMLVTGTPARQHWSTSLTPFLLIKLLCNEILCAWVSCAPSHPSHLSQFVLKMKLQLRMMQLKSGFADRARRQQEGLVSSQTGETD